MRRVIAPPDASLDVQKAITALQQNIESVKSEYSDYVPREEFDRALSELRTEILRAGRLQSMDNPNDAVRGGAAHSAGIAPDPGYHEGDGPRYLTSDGEFAPLLDGALQSGDPGQGGTSLSQKVVNVLGSLAVTGALQADTVYYRALTPAKPGAASGLTAAEVANVAAGGIAATDVQTALNELDTDKLPKYDGSEADERTSPLDQDQYFISVYDGAFKRMATQWLSGDMVYSWVFSAGQAFTTGGANLTSYDWTAPANFFTAGDVVVITGMASAVGGTLSAGTKSLTLQVGGGTARTIFTTTTTTAATAFHFRLVITFRSASAASIFGQTWMAVATADPTGYQVVTTAGTIDLTGTMLFRWVGTHTGSNTEMYMTDLNYAVYRHGGNVAVV